MNDAKQPLAIVTGASRGLGRRIVIELAAKGVNVLAVGRDYAALSETVTQGMDIGLGAIHPVVCDLEHPDAVEIIVTVANERGGADILVNNAAIQGPIGLSWETDAAAFEQTLRVNFLVPVALSHAVLPSMIARGAGWIVNLSGGGATGPRPMFAAYGAAKAALVRFGETLAAEVVAKGVRVNSVAPGAFASGMTQKILKHGTEAGKLEKNNAENMLARDDQANAVKAAKLIAYLIVGAGRDVTGRLISAAWDPWTELHLHWESIRDSDAYTLRRIVPADRQRKREA